MPNARQQSAVISVASLVAMLGMLGVIYVVTQPPPPPEGHTPGPRVFAATTTPGRFAPWFPVLVMSSTETWFPAEGGGRLFIKDGRIDMQVRLGVLERTASSGESDVVALHHRVSDRNGYLWIAECVLGNPVQWPMSPDAAAVPADQMPADWRAALEGEGALRGLRQVDRTPGVVAPIAVGDRLHRIGLDENAWEYDIALMNKAGSYPPLVVRIRGLRDVDGNALPEIAFAQPFDTIFLVQKRKFDERAGAHLAGFFAFPIVFSRSDTGGAKQKDVYFEPPLAPGAE